jgi:hypothetical protein
MSSATAVSTKAMSTKALARTRAFVRTAVLSRANRGPLT